MNEDQLIDAAEREMDLYRDEITRLQAAHEADIASLTDQRDRVSDTADQLREVVTDMLATFHDAGDGHRARVGQVQIAKWRKRAGIEG